MISIVDKKGIIENDISLSKTFNGVLGISVFKTLFTSEVVVEITRLGTQVCKNFVILIVDYPERWNALLYEITSIKEAKEYAKETSDKRQKEYRLALDRAGFHEINIWSWYRFLNEPRYEMNQKILIDYLHADKTFRKQLITQVVQNISPRIVYTQKRLGRKITRTERETISQYFLEELGGLFYLFFDLGYPIDIYPGKNAWFIDDIFGNKYPELTRALGYDWSKWGYIEVGEDK